MLEDHPLLGTFFDHSKKFPNSKIITETKGVSVSASELAERVEILASNLRTAGFQTGDSAIVMIAPGVDLIATIFALILLGGVIVVAEPTMGQDIFNGRMGELKPKWVFAESILLALPYHPIARFVLRKLKKNVVNLSFLKNATYVRHGTWIPGSLSAFSFQSLLKKHIKSLKFTPPVHSDEDDLLIVFTSGTTNSPKMVVHSMRSVIYMLRAVRDVCKPESEDLFYTHLPHFLLLATSLGIHAVIPPLNVNTIDRLRDVHKYQPTMLFGAPIEFVEYMELLNKRKGTFPEFIRKIFIGSAPVTRSFLERFMELVSPSTDVTCIYGMTEILPVATIDARLKISGTTQGDLLGALITGVQVTTTSGGELCVSGPHMFSRYWGMPAASVVETGDLARMSPHGLVLTGRKKDMIIRRDVNIYPSLYESTIEKIPGVRASAMIGIWDETKQDEMVVLVLEPNAEIHGKALIEKVKKEIQGGLLAIDPAALPDYYFAEKLPRSGRQRKVDKNGLRNKFKKILT